MKTVYALQFDIYPQNLDTKTCQIEIENLIAAWVKRKYQRAWNVEVNLDFQEKSVSPLAHHAIVTGVQESDEFRYISFEWTHPDDQDKSLFWKTFCSFCSDNEKIEASIIIRIESAQFIVKPVTGYNVGKPGIVDDILSSYNCKISGEQIPVQYQKISVGDVETFVTDVLEDKNRVFPVILLSKDVWTELPFVDPENLQKKLLGFAKVVVIDKYASFELTDIVGKQLSCYNGAIRIYWSGFTKTAYPFSHPLYLQEIMLSFKEEGSYIETHLFRLLASIASLRYAEGTLTRKALQTFQNKRIEEMARIRKELQDNKLNIDEIYPALEKSWDENERLQDELNENRARIQELENEIANHRENYQSLIEYQKTSELALPEKGETVELDSVLAAITEARNHFEKCSLYIWDSAIESAEKSKFAHPKEIFDALKVITNVGDKYFETLKTGESMGSWEQFFEARGFKYAPTDSEMTINLYGKDRIFSHKGESKQMLKHLTLGGGDRTNCVQIYFEPNDTKQKIEVGYCGMHLRYYSQRT